MVTTWLAIWYWYNATSFSISPRPKKEFAIRRCGREQWKKFSKYHYLDKNIVNACICYGLYDNDNIIGFIAILHQPHPINKKLKRVSRLVILPDYQGIGLGTKFLDEIAKYYSKQNYELSIVTSAKNLISALKKKNNWIMYALKKSSNIKSKNAKIDGSRKLRTEAYTGRFVYKKGS